MKRKIEDKCVVCGSKGEDDVYLVEGFLGMYCELCAEEFGLGNYNEDKEDR